DTSGVLIAAKTHTAHQKLIEMFAKREMKKLYLAVCSGRPSPGIINAPIGRHPTHRKEMAVLTDGREAVSDLQLLAFNDLLSLVLVRPLTGRTHQIRVHLKHIGCPILGDSTYGSAKLKETFDTQRPLLHAYRLDFEHPITKIPVKLSAPIPEDFKTWMQRLCGPSLCASALCG
ncbi:MAG: RluA family pseudouridine synthase, partial [Chlamydiae bacterium]|nr:RluA family pseudouridine synthase [Chlamydiota bacterium]